MDYHLGDRNRNKKTLQIQIHIYDQELQLVFSGKYHPEHKKHMRHKLSQCSLLFNIDNTGYFIKKV